MPSVKKRQIEVLEKKVRDMKAFLDCIRFKLSPSGTFRTCSGCDDQFLCRNIKRQIENDIKKAYDMVK